ncbi:hypothetical protein PLESTB_001797700 [Pleodorina starrii]|uniref:Uncharacterized protein n=1 Tax=Pleodorina starrii TaxID=330485 RepID=A0A9W6FAF3_9CHLO|nr:hypothetical protein PLESTM_001162100 [Pleodorina starrii]GLC41283.1 hypothetical protein PLESTM_001179600 [Pleodorina starrii]GLC61740.1 hypothetical protein PLESTB_001797700 [Pleodorina starrii]
MSLLYGGGLPVSQEQVWATLTSPVASSMIAPPVLGVGLPLPPSAAGSASPPTLAGLRLADSAHPQEGLVVPAPPQHLQSYMVEGLASVRGVQACAYAASTREKMERALQNFSLWLRQWGGGRQLMDCTPEQVLVYMEQHWTSAHRGRNSTGRPSPSAILSELSFLSTQFDLLGRRGVYDPQTGAGNPCLSSDVTIYRRGYQRQSGNAGYQERSAVPLTLAKYRRLVVYLYISAGAADGLARLVLLRDLLCFMYMWLTTTRGHDCGRLSLGDFRDPRDVGRPYGGFPLALLQPWEAYPAGFHLVVSQLGTKTYQGRRAPPVRLAPVEEMGFCFVRTLAQYLGFCRRGGWPVQGYLFRPLEPNQSGFSERPLGSAALSARLRLHLQGAGLYEGETCHSFRRGALQHARSVGVPTAGLLELGQMRSLGTLQRYLDPSRHLTSGSVSK